MASRLLWEQQIMKKFSFILDKLAQDKYSFIIKRIMAKGNLNEAVELLLDVATQEELIREIPRDWWQHLKQRWMPRWLQRRFPVKTAWIYAIYKYPELQVPSLGRAYVHLVVIDSDKLIKELERDEPKE